MVNGHAAVTRRRQGHASQMWISTGAGIASTVNGQEVRIDRRNLILKARVTVPCQGETTVSCESAEGDTTSLKTWWIIKMITSLKRPWVNIGLCLFAAWRGSHHEALSGTAGSDWSRNTPPYCRQCLASEAKTRFFPSAACSPALHSDTVQNKSIFMHLLGRLEGIFQKGRNLPSIIAAYPQRKWG